MDEKNEELEINLVELLLLFKKKIHIVIISILACMIIATLTTLLLLNKKYESTARVFPKPEVNDGVVNNTQITANNSMVNNYIEIIKGSTVIDQIAERLDIESSYVSSAISVSNQTNTQIITISARTTDPELSKNIVDEAVNVFIAEIQEKLEITNITIVDSAKINTSPVSPSLPKNLAIGAVIGILVGAGYIFITFIMDTRIHTKDEAEQYLGLPVIGVVPDME